MGDGTPTEMAGDQLVMNAGQVAACLGISQNYVYKLVAREQLPCVWIGRRVLFRRDVIERWLEQHEQPAKVAS